MSRRVTGRFMAYSVRSAGTAYGVRSGSAGAPTYGGTRTAYGMRDRTVGEAAGYGIRHTTGAGAS
jgi:hypothetical protein